MASYVSETTVIKSTAKRSKAPVFKTGLPYTASRWPIVDSSLQESILLNLSELLSPLGQWRATIPRSKGKRHKRNEHKRKREAEQSHVDQQEASAIQTPAPTIGNHVTIGYNTTMRAISNEALQADGDSRIAVVFLTQPTNSVQYAHLPILAAQATPPVVLVPLLNSESRLCIALGLARVGIIGLRKDAPGSSAILAMTQEIEPVQVPFLDEVRRGQWLETNIECATSIAQDTRET